jgi:hypothetical protein
MEDGDVVRDPWALQPIGDRSTVLAECRAEEVSSVRDRLERPEAMNDPDPEARPQERPVTSAPKGVLGPVPAETRDVVAPVVMHDEQPAARPEDPIGLTELDEVGAPERRPCRNDGVRRLIRDWPAALAVAAAAPVHEGLCRGHVPAAARESPRLCWPAPDEDDVAALDRPQLFERPPDLAFDVEREHETLSEGGFERKGEVGHGGEVYGRLTAVALPFPIGGTSTLRRRPPARRGTVGRGTIAAMIDRLREMPQGIRLFLFYAALILAGIGISLRFVIDLAIGAPVSGPGVVVMVLLAYTIFTTTLVLQRKEASRGLALGLSTLTLPLIPYLLLAQLIPQAIFVAAFAALLFRGLLRPEVRAYLNEA